MLNTQLIHSQCMHANTRGSEGIPPENFALSESESEGIICGYFTLQADLHNRVTVCVHGLADYLTGWIITQFSCGQLICTHIFSSLFVTRATLPVRIASEYKHFINHDPISFTFSHFSTDITASICHRWSHQTIFQTILLEPQLQHSNSVYCCVTIVSFHNIFLGRLGFSLINL